MGKVQRSVVEENQRSKPSPPKRQKKVFLLAKEAEEDLESRADPEPNLPQEP